jgi:hypothetical protein
MRNFYEILAEKPEGKRPLRKSMRGWEDTVKTILGKYGLGMCFGFILLKIGAHGGLL